MGGFPSRDWILASILSVTVAPAILADHPTSFPWPGVRSGATPGSAEAASYRVLSQAPSGHKSLALWNKPSSQTGQSYSLLNDKQRYSYGWFGSNPQPQWGVHFGITNDNIQWTRR